MKIKVSQIYKASGENALRSTAAVTCVYKYPTHTEVDYITKQGVCFSHDDVYFLKLHRELITEYPTWQEAVNSSEFNS